MSSFKLEKGGDAKEQTKSAGALLLVLGIVFALIASLPIGALMLILGVVLLIAGFAAKE